MKHKSFTLGGFVLGFLSWVFLSGGFLSGVYVRGGGCPRTSGYSIQTLELEVPGSNPSWGAHFDKTEIHENDEKNDKII